MMNKIIYFIIGALIIALLAFAAGMSRGKSLARQACIDQVSENCEYICGVGKDFYFPDLRDQKETDSSYPDETAVAYRRIDYGKKSNQN